MKEIKKKYSENLIDSLKKKVSKLNHNEFFVIFYHFWGRMSLWEISERLRLPYSETNNIYENTLKKLKDDYSYELAELASIKL